MKLKKFIIIAGNYGSGKTEISLNLALAAAREGKRTMLLDMDIVNPYFRSSVKEEELEAEGIRVVKPCFANTTVDVPSLPAEIYSPFDLPLDRAIFDAGGDPVGASALGQLHEKFAAHEGETEFLYIINAMRPMQGNSDEIIGMLREIEEASKVRVTGLVNNTNLAAQTAVETVIEGQRILEEVSAKTGIPQKGVAVREDLAVQAAGLLPGKEIFPVRIFLRPDWLDETE